MNVLPCALCGYDAPGPECPHCKASPLAASLRKPLRGPLLGILEGVLALPQGLMLFLRTRGTKRWMLPPLLLTCMLMVLCFWWVFGQLDSLMERNLPETIEIDSAWAWLDGLSDGWSWMQSAWVGLVGAVQWTLNAAWGLVISKSLRILTWFLIGSLVMWYCFSIAYEALAGPFLDEIQARLEGRWFGMDPRSRLERPNDIPSSRCASLTGLTFGLYLALNFVLWRWLGPWSLLGSLPFAFVPALAVDARFWGWSRWVAGVELRAILVSLQATFVTLVILICALPLYFVPFMGYFLFAAVCGFATAIGLLDIPFERRGWSLKQRMRFIGHHLMPFMAFGVCAGLLLAIPLIGPILMVPAASIGGAWLLCRLDKSFLR